MQDSEKPVEQQRDTTVDFFEKAREFVKKFKYASSYKERLALWDSQSEVFGTSISIRFDYDKKIIEPALYRSLFDRREEDSFLVHTILPQDSEQLDIFLEWCFSKGMPWVPRIVREPDYWEKINKVLDPEEFLLEELAIAENYRDRIKEEPDTLGARTLSYQEAEDAFFHMGAKVAKRNGYAFEAVTLLDVLTKLDVFSINHVVKLVFAYFEGFHASLMVKFLRDQKQRLSRNEDITKSYSFDQFPTHWLVFNHYIKRRTDSLGNYVYSVIESKEEFTNGSLDIFSNDFVYNVFELVDSVKNEDLAHVLKEFQSASDLVTKTQSSCILFASDFENDYSSSPPFGYSLTYCWYLKQSMDKAVDEMSRLKLITEEILAYVEGKIQRRTIIANDNTQRIDLLDEKETDEESLLQLSDLKVPELAVYCIVAERFGLIESFDAAREGRVKAIDNFAKQYGKSGVNLRKQMDAHRKLTNHSDNMQRLKTITPFIQHSKEAMSFVEAILKALEAKYL